MIHHVQMKISTIEDMLTNRSEQYTLRRMFSMNAGEIRRQIGELKGKGRIVIPTEGCDTDDPTGLCHGHPDVKAEDKKAA